jgi:hypothetical protein
LRNLAILEENKLLIIEHNGLQILHQGLSIYETLSIEMIRELVSCLTNLSLIAQSKQKIIEIGFSPYLQDLMMSNDDIVMTQACAVFANLFEDATCRSMLTNSGKYRKRTPLTDQKLIHSFL